MKYIGVSKLRVMCEGSVFCAVCGRKLVKPPDRRHLCVEHYGVYRLRVVDSDIRPDPHRLGQVWEEDVDVGSDGDS